MHTVVLRIEGSWISAHLLLLPRAIFTTEEAHVCEGAKARMMSPEAFGRTHKRHVTDIVRVALERKGVIGFIDVHDGMTLLEARTLIWENVEDAPAEFQFVLDDGVPVSARQEGSQKIAYFYPMVRIRELHTRRGPAPSPLSSPQRATTSTTSLASTHPSSSSSEKVCVRTASGEEFHVWITEDYTFQQLRRDAARYWNTPAGEVALVDGEGCLWPEQARILSLMSVEDLHNNGIILEYKGGIIAARASNSVSLKDAMSAAALPVGRDKRPGTQRANSASTFAISLPPPMGLSRTSQTGSSYTLRRALSATDADVASADSMLSAPATNPVEELWRIFTFYCVNGDSMELECLKAHQFNKLLRDSRVFERHLTPAMVDIIYTSETKGKPQTSGKMNYEEFLNALVKVARAAHTKGNRANSSKLLCDSDEEDELFQRLVMDHILPLAARWPTNTWLQHTQRLRRPEIVSFMSKFLESLVEMFMFYAKSYATNASGVREFYMSYADYQRFINDFCFANLQLSSVEAAHVFLASCSSPPFHGALFDTAASSDKTQTADCNESSSDSMSSSTGVGCGTGIASIQRILESVEGAVAYTFPQNQVGRMCMGVSAFLDALGRIGLTAFSKTRSLKTIHCVKGIFHHLSRGLTRSRVLEILKNHGSTAMHATKFYSGSVAFCNKFLDMWRYEGSPDYLTLDTMIGYPGSPDAKMMSSTVPAAVGISTGTEAIVCSTGAPFVGNTSRRVFSAPFSSTSLFNDKNVPNGSGRGREALDRLVRNAFLRNAITANDQSASEELRSPVRLPNELSVGQLPEASRTTGIPLLNLVIDEEIKGERAVESGIITPDTELLEKPGSKLSASAPFEMPVIDTRQATLAEQTRSGSPPRSPNVQLQTKTTTLSSPSSPLPKVPLCQEDEKVFFESILLKGGVFKKYGQWGNPHRRFVWCSKDFDAIYWRPLNKKSNLTKDGIAVDSMISVLPGNSTRTRYAFMKHLSDDKAIGRCFSVVAEDRRLDLEADSEATRELWTRALVFLMREHRSQSVRNT
ncbi:hypothetical protein PC129_g11986 [Phytophthora cactorum]|uniref:PH domain-containing protein n=2 Tax=Phytophthora cactorum TaxID=29920 RepID=A0A8T1HYS8_9STRA|nr:hypothetical protein Pcac1_g7765 [Phytophthora cactorum]KAG2817363.1 hypothetical protein PC111_g12733 [Phytophthora cactorum]KAG2915130.1 hypothetical protein PC114_g7936 [Phytophthora cactorum]KAG2920770.1 hypothetical protein PC115_g9703 [Phytophthora cactorum]KAG3217179.1 hypothetical protein PC129_g11986 [Phytophthora cactorum]